MPPSQHHPPPPPPVSVAAPGAPTGFPFGPGSQPPPLTAIEKPDLKSMMDSKSKLHDEASNPEETPQERMSKIYQEELARIMQGQKPPSTGGSSLFPGLGSLFGRSPTSGGGQQGPPPPPAADLQRAMEIYQQELGRLQQNALAAAFRAQSNGSKDEKEDKVKSGDLDQKASEAENRPPAALTSHSSQAAKGKFSITRCFFQHIHLWNLDPFQSRAPLRSSPQELLLESVLPMSTSLLLLPPQPSPQPAPTAASLPSRGWPPSPTLWSLTLISPPTTRTPRGP